MKDCQEQPEIRLTSARSFWGTWWGTFPREGSPDPLEVTDPPSFILAVSSAGVHLITRRDTARSIFCAVQSEVGPVLVSYPLPDMAVVVSTYFSQL